MELPVNLQNAIEDILDSQSMSRIAEAAAEISQGYRTGQPFQGGTFLRSKEDVTAYAAFRLPATFAAVYAALKQAKERFPEWNPKTFLDVGAGPGTAMWAASTLWPELESITLIEREEHMINLGKRLAAYSELDAMKQAKWVKADITGTWEVPSHDLVIASYVFNELPEKSSETFIRRLWESTVDTLVIIEPGTPAGFARIRKAREQLIASGAKTIAPCPHDKPCPMAENDWCHFSQRIARSRLHRMVKSGELSYEDEKFAFLCMSRTKGAVVKGLVIRHPQIRKGHIKLELCTPEGLSSTTVSKKSKELYRYSRDLEWGDIMPSIENNEIE